MHIISICITGSKCHGDSPINRLLFFCCDCYSLMHNVIVGNTKNKTKRSEFVKGKVHYDNQQTSSED